jgi:4'-phosphopantetheinyl transferase
MLPEVYVYFIKNNQRLPQSLWVDCFGLLPEQFHEKVKRYYFWKDRQAGLIGKLLLQSVFNQRLPGARLEDLNYNQYNKPFIDDTINFNLSHSGGYVVCACTSLPEAIGIDIEYIRPDIEINQFKNIFTPAEWRHIKKAKSPESTFFKLWTIKESIIKADGRGLQIPLDSLKINECEAWHEQNQWYYRNILIHEEYQCHLAAKTKSYKLVKTEISVKQLLDQLKKVHKTVI